MLRLMGDGSGDSDNLDLVVASGYASAVVVSLSAYLEDHSDLWDFCELNTIPMGSPSARMLVASLVERKWIHAFVETPCCQISLPDHRDTYFKQLSSTMRKNFKYHLGRLEKRPNFRIYRCSHQNGLLQCLPALFELHQKRQIVEIKNARCLGDREFFCVHANGRNTAAFHRLAERMLATAAWCKSLECSTPTT